MKTRAFWFISLGHMTALLVVKDGEVVLEQRPESGLLGGLWCLPLIEAHFQDGELEAAVKKSWKNATSKSTWLPSALRLGARGTRSP